MAVLNTFNMFKRLSSLSGSINTGESAGAGVLLSGGWKYGFARAVITTHYKQCHLHKECIFYMVLYHVFWQCIAF